MEKNAPYFIVGLFVSLMLLGLIGFVIWMAGTHDNRDYRRYTVYFTDSVSGLKKGASVEYKGVEIGRVLNMRISSQRKDLIKIDIEVDREAPVRAHTQATLGMTGFTGIIYLELTTEPADTEPPQNVDGERYPVLQGSGTQISQIVENMNKFSTQGLEQIVSLSRETQRMTESIRKAVDKIAKDPSQILYQPSPSGVEIPP